tara:strand:- start:208 stop:411 length:204 start_codon:yes stop_codon:yes gene_type:complete
MRDENLIELDSMTKWLVRGASAVIILTGLTLVTAIPVIALTVSSKLSVAQDSIKSTLEIMLKQIISL